MNQLSEESKQMLKRFIKGEVTAQQINDYQDKLCWVEAMQFNQTLRLMMVVCGVMIKRIKSEEGK